MNHGAEVPFLRPKELATDSASSAAAIRHALEFVEKEEGCQYDYVIELMCTNPLKTVEDIDVTTPAFDITPAELIHGIITEKGVAQYPYNKSLEKQRNVN